MARPIDLLPLSPYQQKQKGRLDLKFNRSKWAVWCYCAYITIYLVLSREALSRVPAAEVVCFLFVGTGLAFATASFRGTLMGSALLLVHCSLFIWFSLSTIGLTRWLLFQLILFVTLAGLVYNRWEMRELEQSALTEAKKSANRSS